jgi:hypothetical protein
MDTHENPAGANGGASEVQSRANLIAPEDTTTTPPAHGRAGIHALRSLLKTLLRRYGFRCLDAWEEGQP